MRKPRYVQFPLFLLRELFIDKESTLNNIILYGTYRFLKKINYDINDVIRQVIYDYYNSKLPSSLENKIANLPGDIIGTNMDYRGFDSVGEFDPGEEAVELLHFFSQDEELKAQSIEHYQFHQALSLLNIKADAPSVLRLGKQIGEKIMPGEPMPMVNLQTAFNYRDNSKSDFEVAQLAAFIAIRSILGQKEYVKTNKSLILARMFGYAKSTDVPNKLNKRVSDLRDRYSKRYHMDRILEELQFNWGVNMYSKNMRGMFISIDNKLNIEELMNIGEDSKLSTKRANLKKKKAEALKRVLAKRSDNNNNARNEH